MPDPRRCLLIFDIDGTLLLNGSVARDTFAATFQEVTGAPARHEAISFAGMTDRGIFRALWQAAGRPEHRDGFERHFAEFAALLPRRLGEVYPSAEGPRLLDGASALVRRLAGRPDAALALGTGNIRATAYIKLARFGLDVHFRAGGFGDDHDDRADLLRAAMADAGTKLGWSGTAADAWVIGDTLNDVIAARAVGARVLAVGSGFTPLDQLQESGADAVLATLAQTERVVELLTAA